MWTVLGVFVVVLLVGGGIIPTPLPAADVLGAVRSPAVIAPIWLVIAVLFWRRHYLARGSEDP